MPTFSPVTKVFNIPELSEMILTTFTPHDISQCILVCQEFATIFAPILWHTISLRRDDQHALFTYSPEIHAGLARNARYVQVVQVRSCKSLGPFLELVDREGGEGGEGGQGGEGRRGREGAEMLLPRLHTLQFPCFNKSLASYASDDLRPDPVYAGKAATTMTTAAPTTDWLRYNGMFLMRRRYFIDRLYRQRQLHEYNQRRAAQHQQHDFWKQTGDPSYFATKLKDAENKLAQLEEECLVQEKKFPTVGMGLGPALVEQDLIQLRDKIRRTKEEMDQLRVKASSNAHNESASPLTDTGVLASGACSDNANNSAGVLDHAPFSVDYEEGDEQILERFLGRFPHIQTLMSTSIPFLRRGVFKKVVGLEGLRSLSLTVFHSSVRRQVSNVHTLLNACPPNLEILRLSFMEKDDATVDMPVNPVANSTATSTAEQVSTTTTTSSRPTTITDNNTNISAKEDEDEGEIGLDLVQLSTRRSEPLRSLRRLFIEGCIGDLPVAVKDNNTVDPTTAPQDNNTTTDPSADSQTWVAFLERCPNLLTLSLGGCSVKVLPEVGHALKLHCPLIEDFVIGYKYFLGTPFYELIDSNLAILLLSLPCGLKRLRFDTLSFETNSQILEVIQHRFASTLTEISLNDCKYLRLRFMESHSIFSLLHSFRRLESLDLVPSGEIFHSNEHSLGVTKFVSEVFSRPWMCRETLRVLRISIDSVMRKPSNYSLTKEEDMENSRELQRRACQFFGSFPALEELSLGSLTSSPWQRREHGGITPTSARDHELGPVYGAFKFSGIQAPNCLALSLSHGLELMGGLKRLRVFNVARMEHMIETEEVEFMMNQWPRLEFLPGLLRAPWFQGEPGKILEREERTRQVMERDRKIVVWMSENCSYLRYN